MKSLLIFALFLSFSAQAGTAQVARFSQWFDVLDQDFNYESTSEVTDSLLKGDSRVAAFNVQALAKIYQERSGQFSKMRFDFKSLEDSIGNYKKWNDILEEALERGASVSKINSLKKKKKTAKKDLSSLLEKKKWIKGKKIAYYRSFLDSYKFGSYKKDKEKNISHLIDSILRLENTQFDLRFLEEGNGVHELRREIRWFVIKNRVLGGLVQYKEDDKSCPTASLADLPFKPIANSKYSSLPESSLETGPCKISKCLFLGMVEKVNQIGELKDKIERDLNINQNEGDETPEKYLPKVESLYREFKDSEVLFHLSEELNQCL